MHNWPTTMPDLSQIELRRVGDDPDVICTACGARLCTAEDGDTLAALVAVANDHTCESWCNHDAAAIDANGVCECGATPLAISLGGHFMAGCPVLSLSQLESHNATGACPECKLRTEGAGFLSLRKYQEATGHGG